MNLALMRYKSDCEVVAIANACDVAYEQAAKALNWRLLPSGLENPVFGNPWNLLKECFACVGGYALFERKLKLYI